MSNQSKGFKEEFSRFFESPSRESFRELLRNKTVEYDDLDFKRELPENITELAKDILGMGNKSGGVIIFGVEENKKDKTFTATGLSNLDDKTDFLNKLKKYIPFRLNFEVIDFSFEESEYPKIKGKSFRVLIVEYDPKYIPFLPEKESDKLKRYHIFIRHNTSTILAEYDNLQDILNRKLETNYSSSREISLAEHIAELKELYSMISKRLNTPFAFDILELTSSLTKNPHYPEESVDAFINRMISVKKEVIEDFIRKITNG